jgi:hypothetical protein
MYYGPSKRCTTPLIYYNNTFVSKTNYRKTYYHVSSRLEPGWQLPHRSSLKVENGIVSGWVSSRPVDRSEWIDPPHVMLANLGYKAGEPKQVATEEEVKKFILLYGPLGVGTDDTTGEDREIRFEFPMFIFRWWQLQLRQAWKEKDVQLFTDPGNFTEGLGFDYLPVNWKVNRNGLELRPANCLSYTGVLLARDLAEARARICLYKNCPAPYFIASRRNKECCSHPCRNNVNQRYWQKEKKAKRRRKV